MHWFEQLTGLSPDGGSGTLEALYDVALALVAVSAARAGLRRKRATRTRSGDRPAG